MGSIFSKIVAGDIPCHKVAESDEYLAFLDIMPLRMGHVLVIPKKEVDYIFDLDTETLAGVMEFARSVAKGMEKAIECKRIGVSVIGLEVPHAHVHLIPLDSVSDINFEKEKLNPSNEELAEMAKSIREAINR